MASETLPEYDEDIRPIQAWASGLVAEDVSANTKDDYLWPQPMRTLLSGINDYNSGLIAVIGLQGVGKSRAFHALRSALLGEPEFGDFDERQMRRLIAFKWPSNGDWRDAIIAQNPFYESQILRTPKSRLKEIKSRIITEALQAELNAILIDMPDYGKKDRRLITRDLSGIQELWAALLKANDGMGQPMVLFFQKELFSGHFFLGKLQCVELKPFTAEELVAAYKLTFPDTHPFEEAALLEVAKISRGIFRRFKKYVLQCLQEFASAANKPTITVEDVQRAISLEQIVADMELQLCDVFPKAEHRTLAVHILEYARKHPGLNQAELAEALEVDAFTLSRILPKLQLHGYIERKQGERGERTVNVLLFATGRQLHDFLRGQGKS